eukprot:2982403-Pleurochrysis_carterae.AAC.1
MSVPPTRLRRIPATVRRTAFVGLAVGIAVANAGSVEYGLVEEVKAAVAAATAPDCKTARLAATRWSLKSLAPPACTSSTASAARSAAAAIVASSGRRESRRPTL